MNPDFELPDPKTLAVNRSDTLATTLRGLAGAVPYAGSILAEAANAAIRNQRLDRIANYLTALSAKLEHFEGRFLDELGHRPDFVELVEGSILQAARAASEERRLHLANLINNGLVQDGQQEYLLSRFLLRLLDQINDPEVIILRWYRDRSDRPELEARYPSLVPYYQPTGNVIRVAYHNHLADLGLLRRIFRTNPNNDDETREVEVERLVIMPLGKNLLHFILN
jgi:hypothetical protein